MLQHSLSLSCVDADRDKQFVLCVYEIFMHFSGEMCFVDAPEAYISLFLTL